jgi:general secretion pathway protein G
MLPFAQKHCIASDQQGFTMVELLIVVAVIGVLAAIAIPSFDDFKSKAKCARCMGDIRTIEKEIYAYTIDKGALPPGTDLSGLNLGDIRDPWGNPYKYLNVSSNPAAARVDEYGNLLNDDFDLYSEGKDGVSVKFVDEDHPEALNDIYRTGNGGYVGTGGNFANVPDGY